MRNPLVFTDNDRRRLGSLIEAEQATKTAPIRRLDELRWQLEESEIYSPDSIPDDVVTMHSTVRLVREPSGENMTCTVVYPEDVELFDHAISVLDSLGCNLIGCEVGDKVESEQDPDTTSWRIVEIYYQPEREGDFHL